VGSCLPGSGPPPRVFLITPGGFLCAAQRKGYCCVDRLRSRSSMVSWCRKNTPGLQVIPRPEGPAVAAASLMGEEARWRAKKIYTHGVRLIGPLFPQNTLHVNCDQQIRFVTRIHSFHARFLESIKHYRSQGNAM